MQIVGRRGCYGSEPAVLIDGREVEGREGLLAAFEVATDPQKIEDGEEREEGENCPGDGQDDGDAAAQRLMACGWRREQALLASRTRR